MHPDLKAKAQALTSGPTGAPVPPGMPTVETLVTTLRQNLKLGAADVSLLLSHPEGIMRLHQASEQVRQESLSPWRHIVSLRRNAAAAVADPHPDRSIKRDGVVVDFQPTRIGGKPGWLISIRVAAKHRPNGETRARVSAGGQVWAVFDLDTDGFAVKTWRIPGVDPTDIKVNSDDLIVEVA